jgi:uncharacterized membrane protein YagU involved in acid resistance
MVATNTTGALVRGGLAGFAATAPMTMAMDLMHRGLPGWERYPLPPREITEELVHGAGLSDELGQAERTALTMANHFAYGAAAGTLYPLVAERVAGGPLATGIAYGLGVWAASYLGLLPALGLLAPATEHPRGRTALMVAAHVVWGACLGLAEAAARPKAAGQ